MHHSGLAGSHRLLRAALPGGLVLAASLAALLAFGVAGVGRSGSRNLDANFLVAAGVAWRHGVDPYDLPSYRDVSRSLPALEAVRDEVGVGAPDRRGFSYPPNIAPLCIALSLLPAGAVGPAVTLLNLLAALVIALATRRLALRQAAALEPGAEGWVVPALALVAPFTAHVTWIGQTTLFAAAGLIAGWSLRATPGRKALAGVLLAVSAIKPQVALLPLLWVVLERDWRVLLSFVAASLALVAVPLLQLGPVALAQAWLGSLGQYQSLGAATAADMNSVGFQNMFGLRDLLVSAGVAVPTLVPLGLLGLVALWLGRSRLSDLEALGLLLATSTLCVYAHDYDLAMLAPFLAALWICARGSDLATAGVVVLVALLFFPQRMLRGHVPVALLHWREVVLFLGVAALAVTRGRRAEPARPYFSDRPVP